MKWVEMLAWVLGMWFVVRPLGRYLARRADANAILTETEENQLSAAFERLGIMRVQRGLRSQGHAWSDCFVACATGGRPFGLRAGLSRGWRREPFIGLNEYATKTLVRLWDRKEAAFRSFAEDWVGAQEELTAASLQPHEAAATLAPTPTEVTHA
ncbi:MAG TPA: hypothetical protein VLT79_11845 [Gemmatimonadales bacterium]|nr:hypothetical protein [Gemmatimonadales bacterium]